MSERNNVAVVDLGTNKTICLIGRENDDQKLEVVGHAIVISSGVRRGVVLNIAEASKSIKAAVTKASEMAKCNVQKLYLNVTGQNFETLALTLEKDLNPEKTISRGDIQELLERVDNDVQLDEGRKIYRVITQSYEVDGEVGIHNPIGINGRKLTADYRLIVGPEQYKKNIEAAVQMAGYELVDCIVNPLAAAESVISDDEKEAGVVVVDLGAGTSSIAIYFDNVMCYSAIIPFGGNLITNDIKEGCSIVLRQAELLKVKYGQAIGEAAESNQVIIIPGLNGWEPKEISVKVLAYIIQARIEEILESICYQINISGLADKMGSGVVLTGDGAKLKQLMPLVRFKTSMEARIGFPIVPLSMEQERILESPQYATAFGLLKYAVKDSSALNVNEDVVVEPVKKEKPKKHFGGMIKTLTSLFEEENDAEL